MKTKENVVVKTLLKSQNPAPITGATRTYFSKGKQFSHRPEQDPFHLFQQHRTSNFTTTMATLLLRTIKTHHYTPLFAFTEACTSASAALFQRQPFVVPARVRSVATTSKALTGFGKMAVDNQQKFYMIGGKGGVGKTSCAASLAVKFASQGHPTIVVSTDPAHSLSDSFSQDLTGGSLVPVEGVDSPLYALELNPEKAREEFRTASQNIGGSGYKNFMDSMGLGVLGNQLEELKLGELLDSPPPGFDEAIAISKVMQILESQESRSFTRIVFDTAPTGHTLRLLSLADFLDASLGKMMKLKKIIASATSAFKAAFGNQETLLDNPDSLEKLRERMAEVRDLFRNPETTEFVIVTIPTVMAINESSRLLISLRKEGVPVQRLIVNQVLPLSASDCKFCELRRKDQMRAFDYIKNDKELQTLRLIQAPLVDAEIRGVPALKFFGDSIWR